MELIVIVSPANFLDGQRDFGIVSFLEEKSGLGLPIQVLLGVGHACDVEAVSEIVLVNVE